MKRYHLTLFILVLLFSFLNVNQADASILRNLFFGHKEKQENIRRFANESPCVCFNLRKATRAITQIYDDMFRGAGLRTTQIAILNSLKTIGALTFLNWLKPWLQTEQQSRETFNPLKGIVILRFNVGKINGQEKLL